MTQLAIASLVTAVGLTMGIALASTTTGNESAGTALLVGFVGWLTFSASTLLQHNAFEREPPILTVINTTAGRSAAPRRRPLALRRYVIATGGRPSVPDIPGLAEAGPLDSPA